MKPKVQNYHKHTDDTNVIITDSAMTYESLAKRTKELGGSILSSVSHGWQGRYHVCWEIAKKYDLKFIFGTEAYWVKDRKTEDKTNNHIVILAKNKSGMKQINKILSIANEDGFYHRARIDIELIKSLNPNDVFITTACLAGAKYDNIEDIWLDFHKQFGDNFMLEIQGHRATEQIEHNKKILNIHKKYNIKMIVGLDSHFIHPSDKQDRDDLLLSKNIKYHESEDGEMYYLDYPDNEEIFNRFKNQNIFSDDEILQAMDNTNVILEFEDIDFDKGMKLPTIYPSLTQEEKNKKFKEIINNEFKKFIQANKIPKEKIKEYTKAIQDEASVILNTNMADYFLLNYEIIKKGKEKGGVITPTGRGCFTKDALVITNKGLLPINQIKKNDFVLTRDGNFNKVLDTFKYEIDENLIQIQNEFESDYSYFKNICTLDHKIFVKNKNGYEWKKAEDLSLEDKLCAPIPKEEKEIDDIIDLTNYSTCEYDEDYIYEEKGKVKRFVKLDYNFFYLLGIIIRYAEIQKKHIFIPLDKVSEKENNYINNLKIKNNKEKDKIEINSTSFINFIKDYFGIEEIKNSDKIFSFEKLYQLNKANTNALIKSLKDVSKDYKFTTYSKSLANLFKILNLKNGIYYEIYTEKIPYKSDYKKLKKYHLKYILERKNVEKDNDFILINIKKIKLIKNKTDKVYVYDLSIENEQNYTIHNMLVHNSSGGFLLNTLFGFSSMNRLSSPVVLFPERFLTEDRVKAGSLVDIDFNVSNAKPFIEAQKEVMGECHAYPMLAFGTIKTKSGFKMYARSQNLDFEIANEISKQIDTFENKLKHIDDEDKENHSLYDYIDKKYHTYIEHSKNYLGMVIDKKIAPCSHILYSNEDIREHIGVMKLTNKSTKEDVLVACIEGHVADRFGYLKNDILTVTVLDIISKVYQKINKPIDTVLELSEKIENNNKVWDIYEKGLTCCVNQCESEGTTQKVMNYKPKNVSELTAFIAAIRPSFKSMYNIFESREKFEYGIKVFDNLIQTEEMKNSFILYQEQLMQTFNFAGFPITECYSIIKAVAKKKPEVLKSLKEKFKIGFSEKLKKDNPSLEDTRINLYCDKVWKIAEDSANYSFNASHALAYAYDSLYCAYLKSHYPYEFYATILELYSKKGEKDRLKKIINEMKYFNIALGDFEYLSDNRSYSIDKKNNKINPNIMSIKGIGKTTPEELFNLPNIDNFVDLLVFIKEHTKIKTNEIKILLKIGYFKKFGGSKKLLNFYDIFEKKYKKTLIDKTKEKRKEELYKEFILMPNADFSLIEKIKIDLEYIGETNKSLDIKEDIFIVLDIDKKYAPYTITLMNLNDLTTDKFKIKEIDYLNNEFTKYSLLKNVEIFNARVNKYINKFDLLEII